MDVPPECSGHSHDHQDHASDDLGLSLRPLIDFPGVVCQNEDVLGMGKAVLKLYEERCTELPSLRSPEDDPELLLHIPFTESVTVHSITVRSVSNNNNNGSSHRTAAAAPRKLKLFVNRDVLDFEMAREAPADATLQLLPPEHYTEGTIDYPMRPAGRFQNISSLQLFFVDNYSMPTAQQLQQGGGGEHSNRDDNEDNDDREEKEIAATEITYIGLKGQGTGMRRVAVETVYESQGMPEDHKTPGNEFGAGHFVG